MGEDTDTRKINHSFLRDHNYVTEGNINTVVNSLLALRFLCQECTVMYGDVGCFFFSSFFFKQGDFQGIFYVMQQQNLFEFAKSQRHSAMLWQYMKLYGLKVVLHCAEFLLVRCAAPCIECTVQLQCRRLEAVYYLKKKRKI